MPGVVHSRCRKRGGPQVGVNLIGDRAYDSDKLDEELKKDGIEMIAPHRRGRLERNRTSPTTLLEPPQQSLCQRLVTLFADRMGLYPVVPAASTVRET